MWLLFGLDPNMFNELIKENSALFARFNLENYFPRLAKVDLLTRFYMCNKGKEVNRRWDNVLETLLENHEKRSNFFLKY